MHRFDWPDAEGAVEFGLTHGDMIRLLLRSGFAVEDLVEVRAPEGAETPADPLATAAWSRRWPVEEAWKARRTRLTRRTVTGASRPRRAGPRRSAPTSSGSATKELTARRRSSRSGSGSDSSRSIPSASRPTAPAPGSNENSPGRPTSVSSAPATSASPECRATRGSAPAAAPSAATIPNASSRIEGTTCTSIAASTPGA